MHIFLFQLRKMTENFCGFNGIILYMNLFVYVLESNVLPGYLQKCLRFRCLICVYLIRISSYIDDSIIAGEDESSCTRNLQCTRQLLESLGFTINVKKSQIKPSRKLVYLAFLWDTNTMILSLPNDKIDKILSVSVFVLSTNTVTVRKLASLIGLYVSAFSAVLLGKFYYRQLEKEKITALRL